MSIEDSIYDTEGLWKIASSKKMMSYSFGFILTLYLMTAFNSLVFYFYEVEVGLRVELVSLAIICYSIITIIISPILGYLTDRSFKFSRKLGFRTPWIIISAVPALLFYLFIYIPPDTNVVSNPYPVFWYLLIMTSLFGICISLFMAHFEGSFTSQFRGDYERRRASAYAFIFPGIILFFLALLPLFIIVYGDRSTFVLTALISVIILGICLLILIPGIRESEEVKMRFIQGFEKSLSFTRMVKLSFKQKNYRINLISSTLMAISGTLSVASGIYFFKDVLRLPLYYSIYSTIIYIIFVLLFVPFWSNYSRKHGIVKTYIIGIFLTSILYLPYLWMTTLEETIILAFFRGIAGSCVLVMSMPIVSDGYDEVTLACERHQEASLRSIRTLFLRSSVIFQALIIGLIHIYMGYNAKPDAIQTPSAILGIRIHAGLIPAILCFFAGVMMVFWYDLKKDKRIIMQQKLREKGL